jgi:glycosyltransferase involved in cell wall biosynthesis
MNVYKQILSITIGTVCYNNLAGLKQTISSVKRLKHCSTINIQFIIADGGSTDGSAQYAKKSDQVDIFLAGPDRGIYHGMNKILDQATGDFIIFMNAGDYFSPSFDLDELRPYFHDFDMIIGYSCQVFGSDVYIRPRPQRNGPKLANPAHQSVFVSKSFYKKHTYNEQLKISADEQWLNDIAINARKTGVQNIISVFELGGISSSANLKHEYCKLAQKITIKKIFQSTIKCLVRYIFGKKILYRLLFFFKYERVNVISAKLYNII